METSFYILISMKTGDAIEIFGRFDIGNRRQFAHRVFKTLRGSSDLDEKNVLFFELMETKGQLPQNIKIISCTLDELAENCRIITKEIFKLNVL